MVAQVSFINARVGAVEDETVTLFYQDEIAIFVPKSTVPKTLRSNGQPVRVMLEHENVLRIARIEERALDQMPA